jgi:hypothetical protein
MLAEISRISQDIDLKTGASSFFVVLTLPTGRAVRASIAAEDAQTLLVWSSPDAMAEPFDTSRTESDYAPSGWSKEGLQSSIPPAVVPDGAFVFGGQDPPPERQSEDAVDVPAKPLSSKPRRRMTTVPKDEMGYPIVRNGTVDPGEVVGHYSDPDEEGIGQG